MLCEISSYNMVDQDDFLTYWHRWRPINRTDSI